MKKGTGKILPVAWQAGLVVHEMMDEVLVYDRDRHKAHCLNQTAAMIWKRCDGKTTVADLISLLERETTSSISNEMVWLALDQLGKKNLLEERVAQPSGSGKLSRREVMRRVGITAAVALPLVTSIVAPTAAEAGTLCGTTGSLCTGSGQGNCCEGLVCCTNINCSNTCLPASACSTC